MDWRWNSNFLLLRNLPWITHFIRKPFKILNLMDERHLVVRYIERMILEFNYLPTGIHPSRCLSKLIFYRSWPRARVLNIFQYTQYIINIIIIIWFWNGKKVHIINFHSIHTSGAWSFLASIPAPRSFLDLQFSLFLDSWPTQWESK